MASVAIGVQASPHRPPAAGAAESARSVPTASIEDLDATPYVLVGTIEQMTAQLSRQAEQLGITRYVVREPAVDPMRGVLAALGIGQETSTSTRGVRGGA